MFSSTILEDENQIKVDTKRGLILSRQDFFETFENL